jgi:hypothetical protein
MRDSSHQIVFGHKGVVVTGIIVPPHHQAIGCDTHYPMNQQILASLVILCAKYHHIAGSHTGQLHVLNTQTITESKCSLHASAFIYSIIMQYRQFMAPLRHQ